MTPLGLHRRAVKVLHAGRLLEAESLFRDALQRVDAFLSDPAAVVAMRERARRIPGWEAEANAGQVAGELLGKFGEWIMEWHFELYYDALSAQHLPAAQLHWQLLRVADQLPTLREGTQLALRRDTVCQRLNVRNAENDQLDRPERLRACKHADLILLVDPDNLTARRIAVAGYRSQAKEIIDAGAKSTRSAQRVRRLVIRPRERRQLRTAARQLNRHLLAGRSRGLDETSVADGFASLGYCHYVLGDADKALKAARRARRLKPDNPEVSRLIRAVRGMPRAR